MSDIAIRVENLGKLYRLGPRERYKALRDTLAEAMSAPFRALKNLRSSANPSSNDFIWALKDVSFEIKQGEVVGVIGRNGAGKSTLLKILSRITEPTEGYAEIHGRVGSLLEVGTGFHPELTGRENIYLNGAILGMKKAEIARKFDEIVAFAEVEKFLDTPVKHYSSGMYVRLAFAVAAHLEPEILLVDEVLAVGDVAFQQKCIGKMNNISRQGRTVLFVSHNLGVLANVCPRAVLLLQGKKKNDGPSNDVIAEYIASGTLGQGQRIWRDLKDAPGNERIRIHAVRIISKGIVTSNVDIQHDIQVQVEFWNLKPGIRICVSIHVLDNIGNTVLATLNAHSANSLKDQWFDQPCPTGFFRSVCTLPGNFLNEGLYSVNAIILSDVKNVEVFIREAVSFNVYETGAMRKEYGGHWIGVVRPKLAWHTDYLGTLSTGIQS
ncbi:MAG: ABC transporter ATP-binding protein [candidate division KSB1 bacterium]|nr:ABC transporter ATP-binding protein [candidate division KSB1 bacterium]